MTAPETTPSPVTDGPSWAAVLAAALGCAIFAGLSVSAEKWEKVRSLLNFYRPSGTISGIAAITVALWLILWWLLHRMWRRRDVRFGGAVLVISGLLILAAMAATFPPLTDLIAKRH